MADNDEGSEDLNRRSAKDIKRGLLRRAWDQGLSAAPIIQKIQAAHARAVTLPEGHANALSHVIPGQELEIMIINLRNYFNGINNFISDTSTPPPPSIQRAKDSGTLKGSEIYAIFLEVEAAKAEEMNILKADLLAQKHSPVLH